MALMPARIGSGGTGDSGDSGEGPVTLRLEEGPATVLVTVATVTVTVEAVQACVRVDHPGDVTLTADADVLATAPLLDGLATLTAPLPGCRVGPLTLSSPDLPPVTTARRAQRAGVRGVGGGRV